MVNLGNDVHFFNDILKEVLLPNFSLLGTNMSFIWIVWVIGEKGVKIFIQNSPSFVDGVRTVINCETSKINDISSL